MTCFTAIPPAHSFLGPLLQQVEQTLDPLDASYSLIPAVLDIPFRGSFSAEFEDALAQYLDSFPQFPQFPERHVVFLLGDGALVPTACHDAVVFMPSCSRKSGALPLSYFAEPPDSVAMPIGEAEFDVGFQGTVKTGWGLRSRIAASLRACNTRPVCCSVTDGYFHTTYNRDQQQALRAEYLDVTARSRFVFCPRGDGLNSLRFFETLALGRLPILVADETALPLESEIPYDEFVVRVPEARVEEWEVYLDAFLAAHPNLEYCSSLARNAFEAWFRISSLKRQVEGSLENRDRGRFDRLPSVLSGRHESSRPKSSG